MTREMNSKTEQSVTIFEQQKKLQDKVDKCKQDVQKVGVAGPGSRALEWVAAERAAGLSTSLALVPTDAGEV